MRQRLEKALRTIAALPEDGWEPHTWDEFLSARSVIVDELGRIDRATAARPKRRVDGSVRAPKIAPSAITPGCESDSAWDRSRKWVEARAKGRCEAGTPACETRGVHAHHVLMRSQGGSDGTDNLLWVCAPCHRFIHDNPAMSYEQGWLRHAFGEQTG